jgi:hypothetical protein
MTQARICQHASPGHSSTRTWQAAHTAGGARVSRGGSACVLPQKTGNGNAQRRAGAHRADQRAQRREHAVRGRHELALRRHGVREERADGDEAEEHAARVPLVAEVRVRHDLRAPRSARARAVSAGVPTVRPRRPGGRRGGGAHEAAAHASEPQTPPPNAKICRRRVCAAAATRAQQRSGAPGTAGWTAPP